MSIVIVIVILLLHLLPCKFCISQATEPQKQQAEYLEHSKRQRTSAWMMLGVGIPLVVVGVVMASSDEINSSAGGAAVMTVGAGFAVASIPVFSAAARNKRKAAELSFVPGSIRIPAYTINKHKFVALRLNIFL